MGRSYGFNRLSSPKYDGLGIRVDEIKKQSPSSEESQPAWRVILKSWWPEIVSCVISIASAMALVLVLMHFRDRPLPNWPLGLTLNTLIAFLATLSRSTFIIPANESVSQSKWLWFREARPLKDFQTFDEASRGPWGSLKLLIVTRASFSSVVTFILLISAFFTATLTQSVVTYPTRLTKVETPALQPSVSRATHIEDNAYSSQWPRVFYYGLNADTSNLVKLDAPVCPTSNCEFDTVHTIGVCTKYWNVTSSLKFENSNVRTIDAVLPNGVKAMLGRLRNDITRTTIVNGLNGTWDQAYKPLWDTTGDFAVGNYSLSNMTIFWNDGEPNLQAFEVALYFCVQSYNVTMQDNKVSWTRVNTKYNDAFTPEAAKLLSPPKEFMDKVLGVSQANTITPMDSFTTFLGARLNGTGDSFDVNDRYLAKAFEAPSRYYTATALNMNGSRPDLTRQELGYEGLVNITENLATSLSNSLHNTKNVGVALTSETFVQVRWEWLAFIIAQIFLSMVLLGVVMTETHLAGIAAIKTSSLPTLFAVKSSDRAQLEAGAAPEQDLDEYSSIQSRGTGITEGLTRTGTGWKFETSRNR
jgi:hypothetical protein